MSDATRQLAVRTDFPEINFYDQDLVNLYQRSWHWISDQWHHGTEANGFAPHYFRYPEADRISQFETCFSTFFLVYSNRAFPVTEQLDTFYRKQEEDGAIRGEYLVEDGSPVLSAENPTGVAPPLFAWAEHNLYHKLGTKKRLREILPVLERHFAWLEATHRQENGLYSVPAAATMMGHCPRDGCHYAIDFNAQQALNALFLSAIGDVLNDKDTSFKYKRAYFSLKTRISQMMWDDDTGFYYDLDRDGQRLPLRTVGAFWTLLAAIPNEEKSERLISYLNRPDEFGVEHPFPTLSAAPRGLFAGWLRLPQRGGTAVQLHGDQGTRNGTASTKRRASSPCATCTTCSTVCIPRRTWPVRCTRLTRRNRKGRRGGPTTTASRAGF